MMSRRLITHIRNMQVRWTRYAVALLGGTALVAVTAADAAKGPPPITFNMVPSAAAAACLSKATAIVTVRSLGPVEELKIRAEGLPPKTEFDLFVIQVPNAPFGLSWYQGDLET